MRRIKGWIQEIQLLMLDIDGFAKRSIAMEIMVALILLVLGIYWGGQWLFMAGVVAFYVFFDLYQIYQNGIVESVLMQATVDGFRRNVFGKTIHVHTKDENAFKLFLPHHVTGGRIRKGNVIVCRICLQKTSGPDTSYRILTYKVITNAKNEG